ncbi:MAG: hypothetical protein ACREVH_12920 [Gammaproteobacteria bacterium]
MTFPTIFTLLVGSGIASAIDVDVLHPRVPEPELAAARALKNPIERTSATIALGQGLYHGKGFCVACHGRDGRGITWVISSGPTAHNSINLFKEGESFFIGALEGHVLYTPGHTRNEQQQRVRRAVGFSASPAPVRTRRFGPSADGC